MSIFSIFKKKPQPKQYNYILPECSKESCLYLHEGKWYDYLVHDKVSFLDNKYPALICGNKWSKSQFESFPYDIVEINPDKVDPPPQIMYVTQSAINSHLTPYLLENFIFLKNGFVKINHFGGYTTSAFNSKLNSRQSYYSWFINDPSSSLALIMNNTKKTSEFYKLVQEFLIHMPYIKVVEA